MKKALNEITIEGVTYVKCCIPQTIYDRSSCACVFCHEAVKENCVGFPSSDAFCGDEDQVCYVNFEKATEMNND
jgi:hypothetical protein